MSATNRHDRWTDQAASAALLAAVLLLVASAAGVEGATARSTTHPAQSTVHGVHGSLLPEATLLPNSAILAPASETRARVGTRLGSAIALDLRHLAGSSLELERRRGNLPPPAAT